MSRVKQEEFAESKGGGKGKKMKTKCVCVWDSSTLYRVCLLLDRLEWLNADQKNGEERKFNGRRKDFTFGQQFLFFLYPLEGPSESGALMN